MDQPQIILVRHGLTDWSEQNLRLGSSDIPLNKRGLLQAEQIADYLQQYPVARIYHTNVQRTTVIATCVEDSTGGSVIAEPRLRERAHGEFEGTPREVVQGVDSTSKLSAEEMTEKGVEPLHSVSERVLSAFEEIREATLAQQKDSVIVSHYGPIRVMLAHALGLGLDGRKRVSADIGSISSIRLHKDYNQVTLMNYTQHLRQ